MNIDQDTLIAYAMGMLSEQEMKTAEQHLRTHPEDALEVKRYLNALSAMVITEEPEAIPWSEEQKLLLRVRAQGDTKQSLIESQAKKDTTEQLEDNNVIKLDSGARSKYQWGLGFAVAACLAAFVFYGPFSTWYEKAQLNQQIVEAMQQSGAVSTALVNDADESIGTLVRQINNSIFVVLNEKLSDEQVYQAWNIVDGQPQSMGIYQDSVIQVSGFEDGNIFGVTVEPAGGSEQPTSTPIVIYEL